MSVETGAGDRSDYYSVWLRLLSLGSGHIRWFPTEQWGRYVNCSRPLWLCVFLVKLVLCFSQRPHFAAMLQLLCSPACC